jgi:hypothetical protein
MGGKTVRKMTAVVLFLFALGVGVVSGSARAQDGQATFNITNSARYTIFLKFYSQDRSWVWPGSSEHYTLNDSAEHSFTLACSIGEKICFGGGYSQNGLGRYWGVGFLNHQGCTGCCLSCDASNPTHSWNLVD